MGRPLRKQNFGNTSDAGPQLLIQADIGAGEEACWINDQPGSRTYTVSSVAGGGTPTRTGRVKLQEGAIAAEGQARLEVSPFDGVANVQAVASVPALGGASITTGDVVITNGGTGYSVAPTVTIDGDGTTDPTATATIVGGIVTAITVTGGSADHNAVTVTLSAPAAGGTIQYARTLLQHVVKTWEGNTYSWKLGVTANAVGQSTITSA